METQLPYETVAEVYAKYAEANQKLVTDKKLAKELADAASMISVPVGEKPNLDAALDLLCEGSDGLALKVRHFEQHGDRKLKHCQGKTADGYCDEWRWEGDPKSLGLHTMHDKDGRWKVKPTASYCATCPDYRATAKTPSSRYN